MAVTRINGLEIILDTSDVITCLGINADHIAHLHKLRAVNLKSCLRLYLLGHTGGSVAANGGFCFDDFEVNGAWDFDVERRLVVISQLDLHAFLEIVGIITEHIAADGGLLEGLAIHKVVKLSISIEIGNIMKVEPYILNRLT